MTILKVMDCNFSTAIYGQSEKHTGHELKRKKQGAVGLRKQGLILRCLLYVLEIESRWKVHDKVKRSVL